VSGLQARSPNDNTLLISWEPPTSPNGVILNYSISINHLDGSVVRQEITLDTNLSETRIGEQFDLRTSGKNLNRLLWP
jgi:hypothetical protein